ncbi:hypothetical protein ACJX0J_027722, partial [Zea mays]
MPYTYLQCGTCGRSIKGFPKIYHISTVRFMQENLYLFLFLFSASFKNFLDAQVLFSTQTILGSSILFIFRILLDLCNNKYKWFFFFQTRSERPNLVLVIGDNIKLRYKYIYEFIKLIGGTSFIT